MANHSFCENCGTPIPLGETLCPACARHLLQPKPSSSNKLLLSIIAGVLVLIVVAVVIFFVIDPSTEPTDPAPTMVSCIKCSKAIPEATLFCPHCGSTQIKAESVEKEPEEFGEPEEKPEEFEKPEEPEPITMRRVDVSDVNTGSLTKVDVSSSYATSVISQSGNHDNTAGVTLDNDLSTSWQEGVSGSGIGEGITYDLDDDYYIEYLAFNLGNWRSKDWYTKNNVPQALDIIINGETYHISFPYSQECYWVELSEPVCTDRVKISIAAVYPGTKHNDTCIAEVGIYGEPA